MKLTGKKTKETSENFANQRRLILGKNTPFHIQEAYRTLQTNIRFSLTGDGCKKICLTSSLASEGKSTTCLNLAICMAESGSCVLLIDADMRRPSLGRLLIEKTSPGLSNVLAGLCTVDAAIRSEVRPRLDVLFSGELPPNPLELLGNKRLDSILEELSSVYDYIIIDTPPANIVSDACMVASHADGVLYLVHQGVSEKDCVEKGVKQLEMANAKILGFVMNGVISEKKKKYAGYGKSRYGYYYRNRYVYDSVDQGK